MNNENERQTNKKEAQKVSSLDGVVCSTPGEHMQPVYKRVYDKELDKNIVKEVDKFDLNEYIQASKSQTDLAILQKRFVELGEIPNVDPNMVSADFSNYPDNIHEVYALAQDIAGNFAKLPQSIQDLFGNKDAYMRALMDGTYQATIVNYVNSLGKAASAEAAKEQKEGNE